MAGKKCFWCKISALTIVSVLNLFLFFASLNLDYQWLLTEEHVRFRKGFPTQANWIPSPYGTLRSYLFNVTNAAEFLSGVDTKLKLQEVGPIVYRIKGRNEVLSQTDSTLTYRKIRYHSIEYDAEASCSPDILNQTITLPNYVLLGTAAKLHDWVFFARHAFNAVTMSESAFLTQSVNYFLWNFTTPGLDLISNYMPNIQSNCGVLYNALRDKEEVFEVKIGVEAGFENFFRVNSLNKKTYIPEQSSRRGYIDNEYTDIYCPIDLTNAFDNSLFPPYIDIKKELTVFAGESCRTLQFKYNNTVKHLGFTAVRYVYDDKSDTPSCLDDALGIPLHSGMFDVSKCLFIYTCMTQRDGISETPPSNHDRRNLNFKLIRYIKLPTFILNGLTQVFVKITITRKYYDDAPAAFSSPHFYASSYNWSKHFEGLFPKRENHETSITIQPETGIPIEETYRFQSNMPMPDMSGYNKDLKRFSNMVLPTFWYEYDLDDLPGIVLFLMRFQIYVVPVLQPILMGIYVLVAGYCSLKVYLKLKDIDLKDLLDLLCNPNNSETTNDNVYTKDEQDDTIKKPIELKYI